MNKYYFFTYLEKQYGGEFYQQNAVCEGTHPIEWLATLNERINALNNYDWMLTGWQEISEKEYNLFNDRMGDW